MECGDKSPHSKAAEFEKRYGWGGWGEEGERR